jgi:uncharacterized LabA/DUF88 family protein
VNKLPISRYGKTIGDDAAIVRDLIQDVRPGDSVILISGDSDFKNVLEETIARQARVTVVGGLATTSHHLKTLAGERFISIESIADRIGNAIDFKAA